MMNLQLQKINDFSIFKLLEILLLYLKKEFLLVSFFVLTLLALVRKRGKARLLVKQLV